jgi:hypothetical protein
MLAVKRVHCAWLTLSLLAAGLRSLSHAKVELQTLDLRGYTSAKPPRYQSRRKQNWAQTNGSAKRRPLF